MFHHSTSLRSIIVCALVLASCSPSSNAPRDAGMDATDVFVYRRPPVPPGGVLVETEEFTVAPGEEVLMCTFSPVVLDRAIDTRELHSYQFPGGHHLVLYYSPIPRPVSGPHPCSDEEMTDLRFVGGGDESNEQGLRLPDGIGVRIPAGSQLVLQSHYLNLTTAPIRVRDALTVVPAPPGAIRYLADAWAISDGDFAVPPRTTYGRTLECNVDRDTNVVLLLGHTHDWGTRLRVDLLPAEGTPRTLYDEMAGPRLRTSPPIVYYPGDSPLVLRPGDRVRLSCDWYNTTDRVLRFPEEMCVALMYYYPARGFLTCSNVIETRGGGTTSDGGTGNAGCATPPAPSDPCVRPCNTGNELGVGRYCTAGGNQCRGNRSAIFCTQDFDRTAVGFCTKGCSSDEGCGSGARCVRSPEGSGCVPVECLQDQHRDAGTEDRPVSDAGEMDARRD